MRINVIAVCKDEARILPFFLDHYSEFCDTIMVCDGHSTDGSVDIIKNHPKAQLVNLDGGDFLDDQVLMDIRNNYYKQFRGSYDWQIVCDVDEFLYAENIIPLLQRYLDEGITLPKVEGYQMGSLTFPTEGVGLTKQIVNGIADPRWLNKFIIFHPSIDINYYFGCHDHCPSGNVKYSNEVKLKLLHYRYLSYKHLNEKSSRFFARLSKFNRKAGYGHHYKWLRDMTEEEYNRFISSMVKVV